MVAWLVRVLFFVVIISFLHSAAALIRSVSKAGNCLFWQCKLASHSVPRVLTLVVPSIYQSIRPSTYNVLKHKIANHFIHIYENCTKLTWLSKIWGEKQEGDEKVGLRLTVFWSFQIKHRFFFLLPFFLKTTAVNLATENPQTASNTLCSVPFRIEMCTRTDKWLPTPSDLQEYLPFTGAGLCRPNWCDGAHTQRYPATFFYFFNFKNVVVRAYSKTEHHCHVLSLKSSTKVSVEASISDLFSNDAKLEMQTLFLWVQNETKQFKMVAGWPSTRLHLLIWATAALTLSRLLLVLPLMHVRDRLAGI